jgi:hypothetical protein
VPVQHVELCVSASDTTVNSVVSKTILRRECRLVKDTVVQQSKRNQKVKKLSRTELNIVEQIVSASDITVKSVVSKTIARLVDTQKVKDSERYSKKAKEIRKQRS